MKLIVGLGNPGKEYVNTRHNVGFSFIDTYLDYKNINEKWTKKFDGEYLETTIGSEKVLFLKPLTFMNLSGNSVRKIMDYFKINVSDILIVSDDLDLNVGNFKLKLNGSCGGHNGLRSIESSIGTSNYKRLKIGISNDKDSDTKDYVLGNFSKEEKNTLEELYKSLCSVIDDYFVLDFGDLMSKYNRKNR
ncbi:MAG: aminoacyl-tRNA hydrolase [Bacilli bacterium]|nr:aminoacyl-tRNA hydrolase [Bacilli bacterium]